MESFFIHQIKSPYVYLYSPVRQKTEQTNTREQAHKTIQANALKYEEEKDSKEQLGSYL